jgi:RNA polymerase sigma factor (sigma-70 family)
MPHALPQLGEKGQPSPFDDLAVEIQAASLPEDRAALFDVIYRGLSPAVKGFVYTQTDKFDMVDDFVQDTFVKVFDKIDIYDPGKASFPHWVTIIAQNTVRNFHRDDGRRRSHLYEGGAAEEILARQSAPEPTAQELLEAQEDAAAAAVAVSAALKQMEKPQRRVLRLVLKGYDNDRIAKTMGYQDSHVAKTRKSEALKAARQTPALQQLAA